MELTAPSNVDVADLLSSSQLGDVPYELEALTGSGNNRVFKLLTVNKQFLLKWYFRDENDTRDRLGSEYSFLVHARKIGLNCVPQPFARNLLSNLAIYEFVDGHKLETNQINDSLITQAAIFFASLNSQNSHKLASSLPNASEACFSINDHITMLDNRLARLSNLPVFTDIDKEASILIRELLEFWQLLKNALITNCAKLNLSLTSDLLLNERCISPSDFGFHNALLKSDGNLVFVDFEYAGWDDPAKTIAEFFSHPGSQVPRSSFDEFMAIALQPYGNHELIASRVRLLEPIFQLKWCCIIMNEFLPLSARRRKFANPSHNTNDLKHTQLLKAEKLFKSISL